jgi:formylglycine-generating enzyme required for sulfatase activity
MKLVLIPAGEFLMGSDETVEQLAQALGPLPDGFDNLDERPQHPVRMTRPFYLGTTEVTLGQFRKFVDASGYKSDAERDAKGGWGYAPTATSASSGAQFTWRDWGVPQTDDSPVANVSWNDAQAFCEWLSRQESKKYRLPTEAEWEFACRAGTTTRFSSGDTREDLEHVANAAAIGTFTAPVASRSANAFGLYDMHGNVAEWCQDGYTQNFYASSPAEDPRGPDAAEYRILRGGGWTHPPVRCRSAYRGFDSPAFRSGYVGFRVLCEP